MSCNPQDGTEPLKLLLIEGDTSDRALFGHVVANSGLDVCLNAVATGFEAIEYLDAVGRYADRTLHPLPELLVLALKLSGMSGIEFLKWKARSAARDVPTIVFTGFTYPEDQRAALELGALQCIEKPLDFHEFSAAVKRVIDYGIDLRNRRR